MSSLSGKPQILHATDFSADSEMAFMHALRLAIDLQSGLTIIHVRNSSNAHVDWDNFPSVRKTLVSWKLLDANDDKSAVFNKLGVAVRKIDMPAGSVANGITEFCIRHRRDMSLLVLSTAGRHGLPRWWQPSVAERIARTVSVPTLFVSNHSNTWVELDDGDMTLQRILIPVDHSPEPELALAYTHNLLSNLNVSGVQATLLHVGHENECPDIVALNDETISYITQNKTGDPVKEIQRCAEASEAQLLVMTTHGHDGFLDALRGSTTERVLRNAPCPVLTFPVTAI